MIRKLLLFACFVHQSRNAFQRDMPNPELITNHPNHMVYSLPEQPRLFVCRICGYRSKFYATQNTTSCGNRNIFSKEIHYGSLIKLIKVSWKNSYNDALLSDIRDPAHLGCSVFRLVLLINFNKQWIFHICNENVMSKYSSKNTNSKAVLEINWLRNVIGNVIAETIFAESSKPQLMWVDDHLLDIYNDFPDCFYEFIITFLPEKVKWWVFNVLCSEITSKTDNNNRNVITWNTLLRSPYIFYLRFRNSVCDVLNEYGLVYDESTRTTEVDPVLEKIYNETEDDLQERSQLQIVLIIQINKGVAEKNNLWPAEDYLYILNSVSAFNNDPNIVNFKRVVYSLAARKSVLEENKKFAEEIKYFIYFVKKLARDGKQRIKILPFWVARIILDAPFGHIPFLCYVLFENDLMSYFSIWGVVRFSCIIRRLGFKELSESTTRVAFWFEKITQNHSSADDTAIHDKLFEFNNFANRWNEVYEPLIVQRTSMDNSGKSQSTDVLILNKVYGMLKEIYAEIDIISLNNHSRPINQES